MKKPTCPECGGDIREYTKTITSWNGECFPTAEGFAEVSYFCSECDWDTNGDYADSGNGDEADIVWIETETNQETEK